MNQELQKIASAYAPAKLSFRDRLKKNGEASNPVGVWVREKEASCYICNRYKDTYERYLDTFFVMYQRDEEFRKKISSGKGFCLSHFGDLCEAAEKKLSEKEKAEFFPMIFQVMEENMNRLFEDVYMDGGEIRLQESGCGLEELQRCDPERDAETKRRLSCRPRVQNEEIEQGTAKLIERRENSRYGSIGS